MSQWARFLFLCLKIKIIFYTPPKLLQKAVALIMFLSSSTSIWKCYFFSLSGQQLNGFSRLAAEFHLPMRVVSSVSKGWASVNANIRYGSPLKVEVNSPKTSGVDIKSELEIEIYSVTEPDLNQIWQYLISCAFFSLHICYRSDLCNLEERIGIGWLKLNSVNTANVRTDDTVELLLSIMLKTRQQVKLKKTSKITPQRWFVYLVY